MGQRIQIGFSTLEFVLMLATFAVALTITSYGVWSAGIGHVIPSAPNTDNLIIDRIKENDQRTAIRLIARTAQVPFDPSVQWNESEICFPNKTAAALEHTHHTLGFLSIPFYWLSRNPILTHNMAWGVMLLLMAISMFWLVREWTSSFAAGMVAGLLFAFHSSVVHQTVYFWINDLGWTVLTILFGQRFLQSHRWRDALLASLACSLQILTNAYSLLASLSVAFPILAWMISQNPPTRRHIFPGVAALAITMVSALLMVWPYISVAESGEALHAQMHIWAPWSGFVGQEWLIPAAGQLVESGVPSQFPGALSILLMAAAILLPRSSQSFVGFSGDPRWALATSGLLVLLLATGGNEVARSHAVELGQTPPPALPNLYEWLAGDRSRAGVHSSDRVSLPRFSSHRMPAGWPRRL